MISLAGRKTQTALGGTLTFARVAINYPIRVLALGGRMRVQYSHGWRWWRDDLSGIDFLKTLAVGKSQHVIKSKCLGSEIKLPFTKDHPATMLTIFQNENISSFRQSRVFLIMILKYIYHRCQQ